MPPRTGRISRSEPHETLATGAVRLGGRLSLSGVETSETGSVRGSLRSPPPRRGSGLGSRGFASRGGESGTVRTTIFATGPLPPIEGRTFADSTSVARWIENP
jgi:hypothetical protein